MRRSSGGQGFHHHRRPLAAADAGGAQAVAPPAAAQGELQASQTLAEAAHTLAQEPSAIQLRYLQTVTEIAAENNSTTIFPIPIELFKPFLQAQAAKPASLPDADPQSPGAALPAGDLSTLMSQLRLGAARTHSQE